jgi:serine/threonine-protein kinase
VPGQVLAERYKILAAVGQGAMGSVYKVEQIFLRKIFALKTLNSIAASDLVVRRFQKEAQAASRLDHPNLVRAVDFGLIEGSQPFFVMEFVKGVTLDRYLKEHGSLSIEEVCDIFVPICRGMSYAHQEGVIHRDIKPSNIVLVPSESESAYIPKLVDFGIAKLDVIGEADEQALTATGEVFGTPLYMSPEQCSGEEIDKRSDIYSLGCVLFEVLTGAPPFRGRNALETMMQHRLSEPISLKQASLGLEFSRGLEDIVAQMLDKQPSGRYRDCLEVARDLNALKLSHRSPNVSRKERRLPVDTYAKLDSIGDFNLTISGKLGAIMVVASLLLSSVLLFALTSSHEQVHPNPSRSTSSAVNENHEHFLFSALDSTPDDQNLALLLQRNPLVEKLNMTGWKGTNNGLSALTRVSSVRDLRLRQCSFLTDDGLKYLRHLPLVKLDLDDIAVTDKGIEFVSQIRTLEYLNLRRSEVGDKSCLLLARLPKLRTLFLSETNVSGSELSVLSKIPTLRELYLESDPGVKKHFSGLKDIKLSILSLARDKITDDDIENLARARPNIEGLSLDFNQISDKGLLKLAQLSHLKWVSVRGCSVTPAGVSKFKVLKPTCSVSGMEKRPLRGVSRNPGRDRTKLAKA